MSKFLTLWLEAPLQSWGCDSRFDARHTLDFPTKSGVFGLLLAASGDSGPQEDRLAELADAPLTVVLFDDKGGTLRDFHMIGSGYDEKDPWQKLLTPKKSDGSKAVGGGTKLTYRWYLQDRVFAAILELEESLAAKFSEALVNPVFDLYLGRKCCVPTDLIFRGCFDSEAEALQKIREIAQGKKRLPRALIRETSELHRPDARFLYDVPLRFGPHKLYRERAVCEEPFPEPST